MAATRFARHQTAGGLVMRYLSVPSFLGRGVESDSYRPGFIANGVTSRSGRQGRGGRIPDRFWGHELHGWAQIQSSGCNRARPVLLAPVMEVGLALRAGRAFLCLKWRRIHSASVSTPFFLSYISAALCPWREEQGQRNCLTQRSGPGSTVVLAVMDETDSARTIIDKIMSALIYFVRILTNL